MFVNRFVPLALALALAGCGSIGAIGLGPMGGKPSEPPEAAGGLPPPPPTGPVASAPLPEPMTPQPGAPGAPPPASGGGSGAVGRTDLLGGWTIASSGDSCQLFMTLTSWTGGYRASTRGCSNATLKSISAWNLQGTQVTLAGTGGAPVAHLNSSGASRFDGSTTAGGQISFYR